MMFAWLKKRRRPLQTPGAASLYREASLRRAEEVAPLLDDLADGPAGLGYTDGDCTAVRLALHEAILNGLRHGNGGDPAKCVRVRYCAGADAMLAEVEDEGPGFDPRRVPEPTLPENLDQPSGRGLLLMRHYLTWVRYSERGNRVTLFKRPTA
jgi:serine/threonine-protein kinase RsbW